MSRPAGKRPAEEDTDANERQDKKGACACAAGHQLPSPHRHEATSGRGRLRWLHAGSVALSSLIFACLARRSLCVCVRILLAKAESAADVETIQLPDGGRYVRLGQLNGERQPHGSGTKFRADGTEASGQWRDGTQHDCGKRTLCDGSRFEGEFVDDKYCGLGVYTWAEGHVFEGEWTDGERSGLGVMWGKDGEVVGCGRWAHNELVEPRLVPRSKIPIGNFLSAAGESHCWAMRAHSSSSAAGRVGSRSMPAALSAGARAAMRPSSVLHARAPQ